MPLKIEIAFSICIIWLTLVATGFLFPVLVSTDKLSLLQILSLFCICFLALLIFLESVFNIFYKRLQRKRKRKK